MTALFAHGDLSSGEAFAIGVLLAVVIMAVTWWGGS